MGAEISGMCTSADACPIASRFGSPADDFFRSTEYRDPKVVKILLVGNDFGILDSIKDMASLCNKKLSTPSSVDVAEEEIVFGSDRTIKFEYKMITIVMFNLIGETVSAQDLSCFSGFNAIIYATEFSDTFKDSIESFASVVSFFPELGTMFWVRAPSSSKLRDSEAFSAFLEESVSKDLKSSSPYSSLSSFIRTTVKEHDPSFEGRNVYVHVLPVDDDKASPKAGSLLHKLILDLGDLMLFNLEKSPVLA